MHKKIQPQLHVISFFFTLLIAIGFFFPISVFAVNDGGGNPASLTSTKDTTSDIDELNDRFKVTMPTFIKDTLPDTGVKGDDLKKEAEKGKTKKDSTDTSNTDSSSKDSTSKSDSKDDSTSTAGKACGEAQATENLSSVGDLTLVKDQLAYSEDMQLYLTQIILANEAKFANKAYADLYEGDTLQGPDKKLGNANLYNYLVSIGCGDSTDDDTTKDDDDSDKDDSTSDSTVNGDAASDKAADVKMDELKTAVEGMHSVFRTPIMFKYDAGDNSQNDYIQVKQFFSKKAKKAIADDGTTVDSGTDVYLASNSLRSGLYMGDKDLKDDGKYTINLENWKKYSHYNEKLIGKDYKVRNFGKSDLISENNPGAISTFYKFAVDTGIKGDGKLSIDSYGNVVTDKLDVIIPYWENMMVSQILKGVDKEGKPFISNNFTKNETYVKYMSTTKGTYHPYIEEAVYYSELASTLNGGDLKDSNIATLKDYFTSYEKGKQKVLKKATTLHNVFNTAFADAESSKAVAEFIVGKTKSDVESYNAAALKMLVDIQGKKGNSELYVGQGGEIKDSGAGDDTNAANTDAESLIARIHQILDVGLFEMLRLTIAGAVSDFYNANIMSFALGDIFHTSLLSDSQIWQNLLNGFLLLVVSFTAVYVAYLVLRLLLGYVDVKQIAARIVILAVAVAAPMLLYSPLVNLVFNKPAEYVLNSEMKRMSVLDLWLYNETSAYENITKTRPNFDVQDLVRERKEDYTIQIVTTSTVDGIDVTDEANRTLVGQYPNVNKMVTVDVSIFDIYEWLVSLEEAAGIRSKEKEKEDAAEKEANEKEAEGTDDSSTKDETKEANAGPDIVYADEKEKKKDTQETSDTTEDNTIEKEMPDKPSMTLFDFLATTSNNSEAYKGIENYEEFYYDTTKTINSVGTFKGTGFKASAMIYRVMMSNNNLRDSLTHYDNIGALLEEVYSNNPSRALESTDGSAPAATTGIGLSDAAGSEEIGEVGKNAGKPYSDNEISQMLFDLSTTNFLRKEVYGKNTYTQLTNALLESTWSGNESAEELVESEDILNVTKIVQPMNLVRSYGKRQLGQEVGEINRKVFDQYVSIYSPLTKIMDSESGNFTDAKGFIIGLETFFAISSNQDIPYFPEGIDIKNITLDTYVRSLFIPMSDFTTDNTDLDNVSSYIAINNDLLSLILFCFSLVFLLAYGLVKFIVLFVLLMPLILISFFFNYVIAQNANSKAWLGSLMILLTFALCNLGLMLLWKGLIYFMSSKEVNVAVGNYSVAYPYVLAHAAALIGYIFLIFKFALIPLYRTVKSDIRNLGGETFAAKIGDLAARFSNGVNGLMGNIFANSKGAKENNAQLGTVKLDKEDERLAMFARDKGQTQTMMNMLNAKADGSTDKPLNTLEEDAIAAVNAKLDSDENSPNKGPNTLLDKVNMKNKEESGGLLKGGIRKLATRVSNSTNDKLTNTRRGIGRGLGNSLEAGIGSAGNSIANRTGLNAVRTGSAVLGSLLGNAAQAYVGGEVSKISRGAEAIRDIADFTNQGVAAGANATTQIGHLMGMLKTKMKAPVTNSVADAVAHQLNNSPRESNKYSNLKELSPEELQQMEELGIDREGAAFDGADAGRDENLLTIDTGNSTLSNLLASTFGKDGGVDAVASNNLMYLNLSEKEFANEAKKNKVIDELYVGLHEAVADTVSKEMVIEDIGSGPLAQKITSTIYSFGSDARYHDFISKAVAKQTANGIAADVSYGDNNELLVKYGTAAEAKLGIAEISDAIRIKSKVLDGALAPSYGISAQHASTLEEFLHRHDIVASRITSGDSVAYRLQNHHADKVKFEEELNRNRNLKSRISELSGNHLAVENNAIVKDAILSRIDSKELELHKDVEINGTSVIAISDKAKLALNSINESYTQNRAQTISDVIDFTNQLNNTVLGLNGGITTGVYHRGSNMGVEDILSNSLVGKEHYIMRNTFDFAASENLTTSLQRQRALQAQARKDGQEPTISRILPEELDFLREVDRIRTDDIIVERYNDSTVNIHAANGSNASDVVSSYMNAYERAIEARKIEDSRTH